jgi:hypothetical protein
MSQKPKCEFTHKRGAKIITHILFIKPDLSGDRAFFVSPSSSTFHKLAKESRFLTRKWRFGGGITPPDRCSIRCAPHCCGAFFLALRSAANNRIQIQIHERLNKRPDPRSQNGANIIGIGFDQGVSIDPPTYRRGKEGKIKLSGKV